MAELIIPKDTENLEADSKELRNMLNNDIVILYKDDYVHYKDETINYKAKIPYNIFKNMVFDFLKTCDSYEIKDGLVVEC